MNLYIWQEVANLTESYHDSGGVAVVAETEDEAYAKIPNIEIRYGRQRPPRVRMPPTAIFTLADAAPLPAETVFVFPDAGCC